MTDSETFKRERLGQWPAEEPHCPKHREYDISCRGCVDERIKARGGTICHHTEQEGCTGHGDF
jgi:hypothetical protein